MMKRIFYPIILIALLMSCRKPYNPPAISSSGSYLVVEGVINATGVTTIQLSRTVNISSSTTENPVTGAALTVESNQGDIYPLTETASGSYQSASLILNTALQYHIRIKTPDNKQYLSSFEPVKITPPVDSVGYIIQAGGLQIYVNSHDPNNNTHYYRWTYSEAWQFHAKYQSMVISNDTTIVARTPAQMIYSCFGSDSASTILLGSSARLSQDVIYQSPITFVPSTSEKIETKYSILVSEYALTGDAYNFWTNLKKNTEQLGSIFDPQPSNINGNIANVADATEPVIGYISVSTVQSKRIFIANSSLPAWSTTYPYNCEVDSEYFDHPVSMRNDVQDDLVPLPNSLIPITDFYLPGAREPSGYLATGFECVDCTIRGTKIAPPFWK
jgi:hypothetical protein